MGDVVVSVGEIIDLVKKWHLPFSYLEWVVPIVVVIVSLYVFQKKIKKAVDDATGEQLTSGLKGTIETAMNEALGGFRVEVRKIVEDALTDAGRGKVEKQRPTADVATAAPAGEVQRKTDEAERRAREAEIAAEDRRRARADLETDAEEQYEKNWGELRALWGEVWSWTKEQVAFAIEHERQHQKRGVVIGNLSTPTLQSPASVIDMLWRYGYYGNRSADLALEMAEIFHRYRTKRLPVDEEAIREFRRKYNEWRKLDN